MSTITIDFLTRILYSLLAGIIIGIEREWRLRSAGLPTNTLVAIGATSFVMASTLLTSELGDPSRVLGQIATGVGFLGAGVIMRDGINIHGLNSAATIWCSAAVGALIGLGLIKEAYIVAGIVVFINLCVRWLGDMISRLAMKQKDILNSSTAHFFIDAKHEAKFRYDLINQINNFPSLTLRAFYLRKANLFSSSYEIICEIPYDKQNKNAFQQFITAMTSYEYVLKVQQENGSTN